MGADVEAAALQKRRMRHVTKVCARGAQEVRKRGVYRRFIKEAHKRGVQRDVLQSCTAEPSHRGAYKLHQEEVGDRSVHSRGVCERE